MHFRRSRAGIGTDERGTGQMITETESYKGRKFVCDSCGYVVSSDAMSDFDVDDFNFCPCCGRKINEV